MSRASRTLLVAATCLTIATLSSSTACGTVVRIDFNDHAGGAAPLGGTTTGTGFGTSVWENNSGTSMVFDEDLMAPAGTNFNLTQSAGNGAVRDDVSDSNIGHSTRVLDVPLTGNIWGTFLIRLDSPTSRAGLDFNRAGLTHADPRLLGVGDGRFFLGGDPDNAPTILTPLVGNDTIGSGSTLLYLFHMDLEEGTWDTWLNPDVNNPKAPTASTGIGVGSITSVGITSYDNSATGLGGWVDFVTISDGPNAYMDVTGVAAPPTSAEWVRNGGGNWNDPASWNTNPFVPTFGQDFLFGSALTSGSAVVNQDTDVTAGSITFNNANSYQISGNPITLSGDAAVTAMQGSHTIASNIHTSSRPVYTLSAGAGAQLNMSGDFVNDNSADGSRSVELVLDGAGTGNISGNFTNGAADVTSLRKIGTGTWTISNGSGDSAQQPNGNVTIAGGTLEILDSQATDQGELAATNITVLAGGTFDVDAFTNYSLQPLQSLRGDGTVRASTLGISGDNQIRPGSEVGTLTVQGNVSASNEFAAPGGGFHFDLADSTTIGSGVNDLVEVSGTLTLDSSSGGVNITVLPSGAGGLANGNYRLINAASIAGGANSFTLNNSTRYNMSLTTTATQVNLNVSGSNANLTWAGSGDNKWDLNTTQNWSNGGSPDVFFNADVVTFSDTATNKTVDLLSTVLPASITINNSAGNDYTIDGIGSIAGGTGITKQGAGRATIGTSNSFDGEVTVSAGTLHAAANGALGSAAGGTTVAGGATLDVGGADMGDEQITVSGAGEGGQGAITSTGVPPAGFRNIRFLTLTGDTTFGAEIGARWDIRSLDADSPATLAGGGHDIVKEGAGIVSIADVGDSDLGDITINNGILAFQFSSTLGRAGTVTVNPGGELGLFSNDVARPVPTPTKTIILGGGTLSNAVGGTGSAVNVDITTPINLTASSTIAARGTGLLTISTPLSGAGHEITKTGNGTLVLNSANTYTGDTFVQEGTLAIGMGSIASSPLVDVQAGTTLDASAGGYPVPGGQTLRVAGGATGNITVQNSAVFEAGTGERTNGTLTGNLVVESGGTLRANTGLGVPLFTQAFAQNSSTIGTGNFRYIAFEAEDFTNYNDRTTSNWAVQEIADADGAPALGGSALVATVSPNTAAGIDDTAQYDLVFTQPGTYTWYVRTSAPGGQADSFFGPDRNADSANPAVRPSNASGVDRSRFGVAGELKDAEGTAAIATTWDWLRSDPLDPAQGNFVGFEQVVVTQEDVDNQTVFSLEFEPRQVGARLDKMVLVTTPAFTGISDANLDAVAQNATGQFVAVPAPFLTFEINGDLALNTGSTLAVDIRGADDFDNLDVTGSAQLAGTLAVNLDGFTPQVNDTFTILTADSLINNLALGGPHGAGFNLSASTATDLVLTFTGIAAIPGDYNDNGVVDAADYVVWRDSLGSMSDLDADGDGDGTVNQADYGVWRANFGRQSAAAQAASAAVPEPVGVTLLMIGTALLALHRARRSSRVQNRVRWINGVMDKWGHMDKWGQNYFLTGLSLRPLN